MLYMLRNAGWCIATMYRKPESTKTTYTKIKLSDCKDHYLVVKMLSRESSCQRCIASGNIGTTNSCSTSHQEILDEDSVDISGVASKINQEYGINITEEKLAVILSSHRLLSGAKMAGSFASLIQSDFTCKDNDVAGCLLLLHENSTLILEFQRLWLHQMSQAIRITQQVHWWIKNSPLPWKKQFKNFIPQLELWMKNYCLHSE